MSETKDVQGTVVAVQANFYHVQLSHVDQRFLCTRRTRLKKIGQRVMVGDRVRLEELDWPDQRGAIAEVLPRQTELDRPPVANADQLLLVFALAEPELDPWQLSRFLVKGESTGLDLLLCLNKQDLLSAQERQEWLGRLQHWGYPPIVISVERNQGITALETRLKNRTTVVAGPSGVGKSSLINRLIPQADLRVGHVSGKLQRGRHTTRHVELFPLLQGGLLADSPGFNQPDLDILPQELEQYFPEIQHRLSQSTCQFKDCLHLQEPHCAVRGDWERYSLYKKFLEGAIAYQESLQQTADVEDQLKVKITAAGKRQYEPKLAQKRYRRSSRRERQQNLKDLYEKLPIDDLYGDES